MEGLIQMNDPYANEEENRKKSFSFWHRQFSDHPTWEQISFDALWGIIAPLLCLIADPIIFRDRLDLSLLCTNTPVVDDPLSPRHLAIFAYSLIGLGMITLMIWLIAWRWLGSASAIFAGVLIAGAESALALAVGLTPLSIAGLFFAFIGVCGFTPFLTSFVYLRNGIRAWRIARQHVSAKPFAWLLALALTATLAVYVIPAYIQWQAWVSFPETRIVPTPTPCPPDP